MKHEALAWSRPPAAIFQIRRKQLFYVLSAVVISAFLFFHVALSPRRAQAVLKNAGPYKGPVAVATFLGGHTEGHEDDRDDEDTYFVGARLLAYQLIHAPRTRLEGSVPFLVVVGPNVRESKRQRLRDDGAIVVPVDSVEHNLTIQVHRWDDTFTKLRLFDSDVVPYERVLLVDTDIVLTRPIDAIFRDPNAYPMMTLKKPDPRDSTSGAAPTNPLGDADDSDDSDDSDGSLAEQRKMPDNFMIAATPETMIRHHEYPFRDPDHSIKIFNSGFLMYQPSREIFKYYISLLDVADRWYEGGPDQNLLNYAHRYTGPMPWRRLDTTWHINWPHDEDLAGGMATLHVKWWSNEQVTEKVKDFAAARRWEMEGYWSAKEMKVTTTTA
ncbi:uncharacterized protein N7459_001074 [Penicillium hispanicum]|uniref:uncharacterized protein n=1 Tax=Penicillium hispanicum TaxID=1080232 RepID=UPI0025412384|nr:uncharacterized protein N7459_001074 [Penicillium hispanicum]KAJ5594866.1 hypothetical protein N7459_001074 [Penicillium hispanicum]